MDLTVITKPTKQLVRLVNVNSPTILTGIGVAGLITTVILAIKATPKALERIEMEKRFRYEEFGENEPLTKLEVIETTWKCYIPTAGMGLLTIASIIFANNINLRRNAALASLYSITETTLKEYQAKVVEQIGEKKEEKIRGEIAQDHIDQKTVDDKTVIFTGNGNYLCFDDFSKRYFRSDIEKIRQSVNRFNQKLLREGWLGINEFYYELGLESIELGDEFGWIAERELLEMKTSTKMAKDSGEPCLVIDYMVKPIHI